MKNRLYSISIRNIFIYSTLFACLTNSLDLSILHISFNPFLYLSLISFILTLLTKIIKKEISFKFDTYLLLFFLFILFLSTGCSIYNYNSNSVVLLFINFVIIIGLYICNNNLNFNIIYKMIVWFSTVMIITSFLLFLFNYNFVFYGNKFTGLYTNPNLGSQITMISILIIAFFIKNDIYDKKINIFFLCTHLLFLYFNMSKNTYLILLIILLISFFRNKGTKFLLFSFFLFLFLVFFLIIFNRDILFSSSLNISDYTNVEIFLNEISTERYAIWKESIYMIGNSILLGYGINNLSSVASIQIGNFSRIVERNITATHNIFLQVFFDGGIFSFLIFTAFICFITYKIFLILRRNGMFSKKGFPCTLVIASLLFSQLDVGIINYFVITSFIFWTHAKEIRISK